MKVKRDLCKPKHTVFMDSSDDDNEPSLKKLRYDSSKNYEDKSSKRNGRLTKDDPQIESVVKRSKSDSAKKSQKNSSHNVDQIQESLSEQVSQLKKSKLNSTNSGENNSKPKYTVFVDSSDDDNEPSLKKLRYDSTKNYEDRSDQKKRSSTKEASKVDSAMKISRSDSSKKNDKNSPRDVDQNVVFSSEEIDLMKKPKSNKTKKREKNNSIDEKGEVSRSVSGPAIPSNSDEDDEPPAKKSISDSTNKSESNPSHVDKNQESSTEEKSQTESIKRVNPHEKRNETELKSPMCTEFRTCVVTTLRIHLKRKHSTTLGLAGIFLRCDCGHESQSASDGHLSQCKYANYTMIRKADGPIRTIHDKVTPQCIICEKYPRTALGYAEHLVLHHKTTMKDKLIYLICSCGDEVSTGHVSQGHRKKCDGRIFTLHKLIEE